MLRIIIKPLGAVALLAALATLTAVAFQRGQGRSLPTSPPNIHVGSTPLPVSSVAAPAPATDSSQLLRPDGFVLSGDAAPAVARLNHGDDGAYQIAVASKPKDIWGVLLIQPVAVAVPAGARLTLRFRARCTGDTTNEFKVVFEEDTPPYPKQLEKEVTLGAQWQQFAFPLTTTRSFAPNQSKIGFNLGYHAGHIEIADIQLAPSSGN